MDHHEKHHQHHEKEREERIRREKEAEHREEKAVRRIHPLWFVVLGSVLIVLVLVSWVLMTR